MDWFAQSRPLASWSPEVERPRRPDRRRGKSDPIDAHLAALHVLWLDADRLPTPRADGDREALRILLGARQGLTTVRTMQINRLRALLLTGDEADRRLSRGTFSDTQLNTISRRRGKADDSIEQAVRRAEARRLAIAIREAGKELKQSRTRSSSPSWSTNSHHGCGSRSAWDRSAPPRRSCPGALAGASPIPASSGRIIRHRYNPGGDRHLNRALHDITLTRWRICPRTHAFVARRRAEGKSDNEIRRSIKRYIARELFRTLEAPAAA